MPEPEPQITSTDLLRRADALTDGFTDAELARMVRRRELTRLQRGAYAQAPAVLPTEGAARHRLVAAATVAGPRVEAIVSHASAAAVHGLPLWGITLGKVHSCDVRRRVAAAAHGCICTSPGCARTR